MTKSACLGYRRNMTLTPSW